MREEDLDHLAEIYVETYTDFDVGERWDKKSAWKMLGYWLKHYPDLALTAEYNGKIVGAFLVGVKPWCDGNHLIDGEIFVHPRYQKKGIGTKLTKVMFEKARKKYGVVAWDAYTFKKFRHPLNWYKKMGFREIKDWVMITGEVEKVLEKLG